ncbi:hypothetical protein LSM04_003617 [Trypanosoma melophagium]|uniref:uncharacterized protein n=1 Tax=Trypanosoma melophagium TaxID=715481 RepID=UPI00351A4BDB|nr:hypothetical protein LSM04_003617 [Trypanosoma melophagium]
MSDVQQLRSRRRYRALLRETHDLEQRGQKDETVILELQKLEHEYPFLKEIRGPEKEISSMSFNNTMSEGKEKQSCDNASQSNLIASNSPAPVGDISVGLSMASQPLSYDDSKQRSSDVQKNDRQEIGRSLRLGVGFVFCTLSIWNEAHLPSSLSISSYLMILASTIGSAIFHIHGVDPYAMLGRLISPDEEKLFRAREIQRRV